MTLQSLGLQASPTWRKISRRTLYTVPIQRKSISIEERVMHVDE
jgi:hypothetical protein